MYQAGREVGEGARWSADRQLAWRLRSGKADKEISLEDAKRIADRVGELKSELQRRYGRYVQLEVIEPERPVDLNRLMRWLM